MSYQLFTHNVSCELPFFAFLEIARSPQLASVSYIFTHRCTLSEVRKLAYIGFLLLVVLVTMFVLWQIGRSTTFQFFGEIVSRVETDERVVALTFDDGPSAKFTGEILSILAAEDIKATFFLIGSDLEKNPEQGKQIAAAGHEIGNHSYSHSRMLLSSPSVVASEIEKTDELIRLSGYEKRPHFRPPYGKKLFTLPWYLSQNDRKTITWDVAPESDPKIQASTEAIVRHVSENTRNGSIILLHVMYDPERRSLNAVRPIINSLREKGFRFVTVSQLMDLQ